MIRSLKYLAPLSILTLAACATPFQARVSRFQQLPAVQGQTFTVQAQNPAMNDSLEFQTYANLVAERLSRVGYTRAASPAAANLIVSLDYGVDRGRERIRSVPGGGFNRFGGFGGFGGFNGFGWGPWGHPFYGWGNRAFVYGFNDPFLFNDFNQVESYTVYASQLNMSIARRGTTEQVFDGRAQAQSRDDDLTTLVPNLIEAMFTGFPGNSGETVKITVAPPSRRDR